MLGFLEGLKNEKFDMIQFMSGDNQDMVEIVTNVYNDTHAPTEETTLGKKYHIILFKEDEDGKFINQDKFEAILLDPLEYISELIPQNWYGIIAKKTNKSEKFINNIFDKMMEV